MKMKTQKIVLLAILLLFASTNVLANSPQIIVDAGANMYTVTGQSVLLQGSGYDTAGNNVSYWWSCPEGTLSSYSAQQVTFMPPSAYGPMSYTCTLTVNNTAGQSSSDSTTIFVNWGNTNNNNFDIQTNSAINITGNQATLRGYLNNLNYSNTTYVFFQWGPTTSYGNQTAQQTMTNAGSFNQIISDLSYGTTYHFRAVAQTNNGLIYGQDVTFSVSSYNYYYQNQNFSQNSYVGITKKVINLSSGNLNWSSSVNAAPGNIVSFAITIQPGNQDLHNVIVSDILPSGLIYLDQLTVNANQNYSGSILSGINIGTVYANQPVIIAYQARVAPTSYGLVTLTNSATVRSNETTSQSASASVVVNNAYVAGATTIATGVANNPFTDSFLLPTLLIILFSYLYFSGKVYAFADWLGTKL